MTGNDAARQQGPGATQRQAATQTGREDSGMGKGKLRLVRNSDNGRLFSNPIFEGLYVDEVNGAGAEEVPQYVPTKHELLQLVKYWYGRILGDDFFRFEYGGSDSSELRVGRFGPRRIRRAAAAIGQEAVDQAIEEACAQFKAKVNDDRLWDVFENGTSEQWQAVQDRSWREVYEQRAAAALVRLERARKESPGSLVALVLHDCTEEKRRLILVSPCDSELNSVARASGRFEVEADVSRVRTLMVDERFGEAGIIRGTRLENGEWRFEFLDSEPHTVGRAVLESVAAELRALLRAGAAATEKHE